MRYKKIPNRRPEGSVPWRSLAPRRDIFSYRILVHIWYEQLSGAVSRFVSSEGDGTRTRNHRIDSTTQVYFTNPYQVLLFARKSCCDNGLISQKTSAASIYFFAWIE